MPQSTSSFFLERWTSIALRTGLWLSAFLMISGLLKLALTATSTTEIEVQSLNQLFSTLVQNPLSPQSLLLEGIIFLCLTPLVRVVTVMVAFVAERDWKFVVISSTVFFLLLFELVYAFTAGRF